MSIYLYGVIYVAEWLNRKTNVIWILNVSKYNARTEPILKEPKLLKVKDILKLQQELLQI